MNDAKPTLGEDTIFGRLYYQDADYAALRAELAELRDRLDVMTQCADNYSRMFEESSEQRDTALTQLAAIQGGMGEVVEVVAYRYTSSHSWSGKWHYQETFPKWDDRKVRELGQMQRLTDFDKAQRITAAMAAEVERLKQQIENYRHQFSELHIARNLLSRLSGAGFEIGDDLAASIIALRAELAEVKGREAIKLSEDVREYLQEGINSATQCEDADMDYDFANELGMLLGPLYTTPPASPDVEGLVKALEATLKLGRGTSGRIILESEDEEALRTALSTWRQAQKGKA